MAVTEDHELDRQVEGSEGDGWATAIAGGGKAVVGEVLAMKAVLFDCYLPSTLSTASIIGTLKFVSL